MKLILPLLFLLSGCTPSLHSELARIRAEIEELERTLPDDAPLWITAAELARDPTLDPDDLFEKHLQDHTPSVPDFIYYHVLEKLSKMTDEEVLRQSSGDFPYASALADPASCRGRIWRLAGTVSSFRLEPVEDPAGSVREVYAGAAYIDREEPVLFHVIHKPDVLYLNQDTVEFHGVFLKLISVGPPDRRLSAPLFLAKSLKKFL